MSRRDGDTLNRLATLIISNRLRRCGPRAGSVVGSLEMSVASQSPRSGMPSADTELDLPALGAALWRKKWLILRPTILIAIVTLIAVQVITPKYMSESRIFIEGRDNIYLRPDADKDT